MKYRVQAHDRPEPHIIEADRCEHSDGALIFYTRPDGNDVLRSFAKGAWWTMAPVNDEDEPT